MLLPSRHRDTFAWILC